MKQTIFHLCTSTTLCENLLEVKKLSRTCISGPASRDALTVCASRSTVMIGRPKWNLMLSGYSLWASSHKLASYLISENPQPFKRLAKSFLHAPDHLAICIVKNGFCSVQSTGHFVSPQLTPTGSIMLGCGFHSKCRGLIRGARVNCGVLRATRERRAAFRDAPMKSP